MGTTKDLVEHRLAQGLLERKPDKVRGIAFEGIREADDPFERQLCSVGFNHCEHARRFEAGCGRDLELGAAATKFVDAASDEFGGG